MNPSVWTGSKPAFSEFIAVVCPDLVLCPDLVRTLFASGKGASFLLPLSPESIDKGEPVDMPPG